MLAAMVMTASEMVLHSTIRDFMGPIWQEGDADTWDPVTLLWTYPSDILRKWFRLRMHMFDEWDVAKSQVAKFYSKHTPMVTYPIYQQYMTIINKNHFHHVKGYQDPSTWAREKGGVRFTPTYT